jgi:hypothetical protein
MNLISIWRRRASGIMAIAGVDKGAVRLSAAKSLTGPIKEVSQLVRTRPIGRAKSLYAMSII